ncbi:hypothetical protein FC093_08905 [Ilyomonas limi]|uniref:Uncharacterized protein n=1 Tax=Ilyomonas limi TaxID=2575867 RepID=A0A4U3L1E9_9BACT|nr:hypothetical protein [Ilyomonas limi]TKK68805.1 hypothetical protein FC093_08905 [Ilyomonas limi]
MTKTRSFWISLCLINLCIVAFFGFCLRSKILFTIPFVNYRNFLSAHSHFAFSGWAGLALMTLLIYDVLPGSLSQKKIYQRILAGVEISSLGMALTFPFFGYNAITIFFSTLYIVVAVVFAYVFLKDVLSVSLHKTIKLLCFTAIASLIVSFLGTLGLVYILFAQYNNSILYRDSIYVFLHFQYNGFFTVAVFALAFNYLIQKGNTITKNGRLFSLFLCLSIVPSLFLALLWHNLVLFYVFAAIGCLLMILSLVFLLSFLRQLSHKIVFASSFVRVFWVFTILSFCLKMLLNIGTIFPQLGNAVYGDRPVIIGFLHLVFLGFLTFYIFSVILQSDRFIPHTTSAGYPFVLFSAGIIANEIVLMLQGLGVLLKTSSPVFMWLLWATAIMLFSGALLIVLSRYRLVRAQKKPY